MNKYSIKIEILAEVEAFDENDAKEYISDVFGVDDEVKSVKIVSIKTNSKNSWQTPLKPCIIIYRRKQDKLDKCYIYMKTE